VLKFPDSNIAISVPSKQRQTVHAPAKTRALGWGLVTVGLVSNFNLELLDQLFLFQIPDFDAAASGGAEPVPVGAEN